MINSILCGKLLGDASLDFETNFARIKLKHKLEDSAYLFETVNELTKEDTGANLIPFESKEPKYIGLVDKRTNKTYPGIEFVSSCSDFLTNLYKIWYPNGVKVVPNEYVEQNLDEKALAIWYQDDGHLKSEHRIILSTDSFELKDIDFLRKLILDKFGIRSHIDKNKRIDISDKRHVELFLSYIRPFLSEAMFRKYPFEHYGVLRQKVRNLLEEKKQHEKEGQEKYLRRKFLVSEEAYERIKRKGSAVFNSLLTRLISIELVRIHTHNYRVLRIKEAPLLEEMTLYDPEEEVQEEKRRVVLLVVSDFIDSGLDILKDWTGITRNEYVDLLLRGPIPEIDRFTVAELSKITNSKRTTIHRYIKRYKEFFPYIKVSKQHFFTDKVVKVIRELHKYKNKPICKVRPILEKEFPEFLTKKPE